MTPTSAADKERQQAAQRTRRVLIVDDHGTIRASLRALRAIRGDLDVMNAASRGSELLRMASNLAPDLVVMEFLDAPLSESIRLISDLKQHCRHVRVLVLTRHDARHYLDAALHSGADGYALQEDSAGELELAIRSVLAGRFFLSP